MIQIDKSAAGVLVKTHHEFLLGIQHCHLPAAIQLPANTLCIRLKLPDGNNYICRVARNRKNDLVQMSGIVSTSLDRYPQDVNGLLAIEPVSKLVIFDTVEVELILDEREVKNINQFEERTILEDNIRAICQMFIIAEGFQISVSQAKELNHFEIDSLKIISTNVGGEVGMADKSTAIKIASIAFKSPNYRQLPPIGGLAEERAEMIKAIEANGQQRPLVSPNSSSQILLVGPTGCGKEVLVQHVVRSCAANLFTWLPCVGQVPGANQLIGSMDRYLQLAALSTRPTVILLKDVDTVCPKKADQSGGSGGGGGNWDKLCHEFLWTLDKMAKVRNVTLICTTRHVTQINPKARRPGRLGVEIYFKMPSEKDRRDILRGLMSIDSENDSKNAALLDYIVQMTPSFVGGDLGALIQHAQHQCGSKPLAERDIVESLKVVRATNVRSNPYLIEKNPNCKLDHLGGLEQLKATLEMALFKPLKHPKAFLRFGLNLPKGLLLYGPPGCAKTTIVKCLANEMNRNLIAVSAAQVYSPYVGDSEQLVANLFQRARLCAPAIIFIDEIDALIGTRAVEKQSSNIQSRILSVLLVEMDGIGLKMQFNHNETKLSDEEVEQQQRQQVLVIGATNRPDMIDDALLRPGRFDKLIYVPAPSSEERLDILRGLVKRMPLSDDVDLLKISQATVNYSGADLVQLCNEVALNKLSKDINANCITMGDFDETIMKCRPSLTEEQIEWYNEYSRNKSR